MKVTAITNMVEETTGAILAKKGDILKVESALFADNKILYVSNAKRHDGIWSCYIDKHVKEAGRCEK